MLTRLRLRPDVTLHPSPPLIVRNRFQSSELLLPKCSPFSRLLATSDAAQFRPILKLPRLGYLGR